MGLDQNVHELSSKQFFRDLRPAYEQYFDASRKPENALAFCIFGIAIILVVPQAIYALDAILLFYLLWFWWVMGTKKSLSFKLPADAKIKDENDEGPGRSGKPNGIFYLGNIQDESIKGQEIWFTNSDVRTHILYLGTTGCGKTEGLKSMVTNALSWGSGFVYIDGKADTDLWSSMCSLIRRFGRDDDLFVLNYMTGNSDKQAPSNTMNPFSSGSASYLSNMIVSLLPEAEGDNAMWKERAVALIFALMPVLTWRRDNQDAPLSVNTIRRALNLPDIIRLSRDQSIPEKTRDGLIGYLDTLPGYVADAFTDDGKEKPSSPGQPNHDTTTVRQQHGYLTMQFTRALQSLGDDYGYIFDAESADIDMVDVVLNRRALVVLIPALEKSTEETANLGKIIGATIKGMMGSSLGADVEGESSKVIENKPTNSSTPFMTIFDEVGYYVAPGMAVMAAQARSLGFSLVFSAQDLPALEKRVKEEARSITANCNIKLFGKLEDPDRTAEFFEKQIGQGNVMMVKDYEAGGGLVTGGYFESERVSLESKARMNFDDLSGFKEGEAVIRFATTIRKLKMFYTASKSAKAMRVTRFVPLPKPDEQVFKYSAKITRLRDLMMNKNWTAKSADVAAETTQEITAMKEGFLLGEEKSDNPVDHGIISVTALHEIMEPDDVAKKEDKAEELLKEAGEKVGKIFNPEKKEESGEEETADGEVNKEEVSAREAEEKPEVKDKDQDKSKEKQKQPQKGKSEPISWKDLVSSAEGEDDAQDEEKSAASSSIVLSEGSRNVLQKAGDDLRKSIFKSKKEEDFIDAE